MVNTTPQNFTSEKETWYQLQS